jgi:hypothetical protein
LFSSKCHQQVLRACSYCNETNKVGKVVESTYSQNPWITLATRGNSKRTFVFYPFLETIQPSTGHLGLFKTQLTLSVSPEVILLGVKLKGAILSIHNLKKIVLISCIVQEIIAYDCTRVRLGASEKSCIL